MSQRKRVPSSSSGVLGDDRERRALHDRLTQSMQALACPPSKSVWLFGNDSRFMAPSQSSMAVGDSIKLADGLKILAQYARVLDNACRHPESAVGRCLGDSAEACVGTGLEWFGGLFICCRFTPCIYYRWGNPS